MRAVIQRVENCSVAIQGIEKGFIHFGLLVYLGIGDQDSEKDIAYIVDKVSHLRVFTDADDKMNLSLGDVGGSLMVISQFTLYGDARKGRRPSYSDAAAPQKALSLYNMCVDAFKKIVPHVEEGKFQEVMDLSYTNKGPITILLDSTKLF